MKKPLLWCLLLALLAPAAASAEAEDFAFEPKTGSIVEYTGTETDVVVPIEIGGATVVRIGPGAFANEDLSLTSVVLPEGLKVIAKDAFRYQELLSGVD